MPACSPIKYGLRRVSWVTVGDSTLIRWPSTARLSCSHAAAFGHAGSDGRTRLAEAAAGRSTASPVAPASRWRRFIRGRVPRRTCASLPAGPVEDLQVEPFARRAPAASGKTVTDTYSDDLLIEGVSVCAGGSEGRYRLLRRTCDRDPRADALLLCRIQSRFKPVFG